MDFTIVGLDLSLTSTGWAVGDETGTFQSKKKDPERMIEIKSNIVVELSPYETPVVVMEGFSFGSRQTHAHALGGLGWIVRAELYERDIPYIVVPPTVLKKYATGKGNASKNEVVSSVSAKTGIVWSGSGSDDRCDAWVLCQIGRKIAGQEIYPHFGEVDISKLDFVGLTVNDKNGIVLE